MKLSDLKRLVINVGDKLSSEEYELIRAEMLVDEDGRFKYEGMIVSFIFVVLKKKNLFLSFAMQIGFRAYSRPLLHLYLHRRHHHHHHHSQQTFLYPKPIVLFAPNLQLFFYTKLKANWRSSLKRAVPTQTGVDRLPGARSCEQPHRD